MSQSDKSGFDFDEAPELNITPLVDIMLVLLAILMVTAPVIVYQEEIALPQGSRTERSADENKIDIRVDEKRNIYIQDATISFELFADSFVLMVGQMDKNTPVHIRADKNLKYDDVMFVMKIAKQAGFSRISLVTDG